MDLEQEDLKRLRRCVRKFKELKQACSGENFPKGSMPQEWEDKECYVWNWEVTPTGLVEYNFTLRCRHRTTPKGVAEFSICYDQVGALIKVTSPLLSTDNRKAGESVNRWLYERYPHLRPGRRPLRIEVNTYRRHF